MKRHSSVCPQRYVNDVPCNCGFQAEKELRLKSVLRGLVAITFIDGPKDVHDKLCEAFKISS